MPGKYACFLCGHDQNDHNLIEGCPHCKCAATPGEAGRDPSGKYAYLRPREGWESPLHDWQKPEVPTEERLRKDLHDAVQALGAATKRRDRAEEALDAFLAEQKTAVQ
jgi:hypothetical protein